jgi:hypothetical protein
MRHAPLLTLLSSVAVAGCGSKEPSASSSSSASPRTTAAKSAEPAAKTRSAPGAGDKSGKDVANASALEPGKPASFDLACGATRWFGPFSFQGDKDTLKIAAEATAVKDQACVGGDWRTSSGEFVAVSGVGCSDGGRVSKQTLTIDFDPKSGGNDKNPVFLRIGMEKDVVGCADAKVTLSLP